MGMGMNHWEWEGMGLKKTFPHTSSVKLKEIMLPKICLVLTVSTGISVRSEILLCLHDD